MTFFLRHFEFAGWYMQYTLFKIKTECQFQIQLSTKNVILMLSYIHARTVLPELKVLLSGSICKVTRYFCLDISSYRVHLIVTHLSGVQLLIWVSRWVYLASYRCIWTFQLWHAELSVHDNNQNNNKSILLALFSPVELSSGFTLHCRQQSSKILMQHQSPSSKMLI